jgi:uncharacterized protein (DUF488 family)
MSGEASTSGAAIYTIGHSTRSLDTLVDMLREHGVQLLVDVRTVPRSRTNPQHNQEALALALPARGIRYIWLGAELGGLRKRNRELGTLNAGWQNPSFQGYADYMQSGEFAAGVARLEDAARGAPAALMCAEVVHWRCHRNLLSDALVVRGWRVLHILAAGKPPTVHGLPTIAKVEEGTEITYPPVSVDAALAAAGQRRITAFFDKK